ncbi:hypothetical protein [Pseudomonas sp. NPDC088444]|uniref:hypothetical protein n=1 Tax=Pseudomonas sp. NPDC088444 TaxID=3364456 RepID=UPI00384DB604
MSDVFYTPPAADLQPPSNGHPEFFTVAPRKLIVMMLLTHGLYVAYWFYQNWKNYRNRSGREIWPLARTLFALFYTPSLFCKIDRASKVKSATGMPYWGISSVLYVLLPFIPFLIGFAYGMYRALSGSDTAPIEFWLDFFMGTAVIVFQSLIVLRVQRFINLVNEDPNGMANARYSVGNFIWILIGLLVWFSISVGTHLAFQA